MFSDKRAHVSVTLHWKGSIIPPVRYKGGLSPPQAVLMMVSLVPDPGMKVSVGRSLVPDPGMKVSLGGSLVPDPGLKVSLVFCSLPYIISPGNWRPGCMLWKKVISSFVLKADICSHKGQYARRQIVLIDKCRVGPYCPLPPKRVCRLTHFPLLWSSIRSFKQLKLVSDFSRSSSRSRIFNPELH